tara:strand:- start:269 stop:523 length:255 start_codon:yes stop_codon:yes gene_type:complete
MNKHSADATTAEEAIAIQSALDSDMATEVAMQDTLLTPRFYTTDFDELDAIDVSGISENGIHLLKECSVIRIKDTSRRMMIGTR